MQNLISQDGFNFSFKPSACEECQGQCCTGESGYIFLSNQEIVKIADFSNMNARDFAKQFLFLKNGRFSIKERHVNENYECLFFEKEKNRCAIYPVRPNQCRTFPFWSHFKSDSSQIREELQNECMGVIYK